MNLIKSVYKFISPKYQKLFMEYKVDFKPRYGYGKPPHPILYKIINANRTLYSTYLGKFLSNKRVFHSIKTLDKEVNEFEPCWNNRYLPGLDIVALYSIIQIFKPRRYIEIGSGNSTKVVSKSIKDNNLDTEITSIDPLPRAYIDDLADKVIRKPLEHLENIFFVENLEANDILFIDNSHRCLPNSDVTVCFLELLPKLKSGVIVHIHDIYLPYDYPQFMADRFYSEQYLLACYLLASAEKFDIIMPNYFVSEDKKLSSIIAPIWEHENLINVERHGGSFWFKIV